MDKTDQRWNEYRSKLEEVCREKDSQMREDTIASFIELAHLAFKRGYQAGVADGRALETRIEYEGDGEFD